MHIAHWQTPWTNAFHKCAMTQTLATSSSAWCIYLMSKPELFWMHRIILGEFSGTRTNDAIIWLKRKISKAFSIICYSKNYHFALVTLLNMCGFVSSTMNAQNFQCCMQSVKTSSGFAVFSQFFFCWFEISCQKKKQKRRPPAHISSL